MTKDEALKMAIEYIDKLKTTGQTNWLEINVIQNACKEALEQPKQFLGMKEIPYKDWVLRFYKMPNDLWYTEGINEEWMNEMVEASKQQPKEPQYSYVSKGDNGKPELSFIDHQESIGKIKLEVDDD